MSLPETSPPETPPVKTKRRWPLILALLVTVLVVGVALAYWFYSPPLTSTEQQLVGKWVMPTGPNPPPNAVRTVYDLGPDRRLTVTSQVFGTGESAGTMTGTWRVEEGHLVLDAWGEDNRHIGEKVLRGFGMSSSKLFGNAPEPPHMKARFRLLGCDEGAFQVEDEPGSVAPFHRTAD